MVAPSFVFIVLIESVFFNGGGEVDAFCVRCLCGCIGRRPDVAAPGLDQRLDLRAVAVTLQIFTIMTSAGHRQSAKFDVTEVN
jgi:hypothetical protein